jgi:hypothetical protein
MLALLTFFDKEFLRFGRELNGSPIAAIPVAGCSDRRTFMPPAPAASLSLALPPPDQK